MNRIFKNPALDIPSVGRITMFATEEDLVRREAEAILLAIIIARGTSLVAMMTTATGLLSLNNKPHFPQAVSLYDGDRLVAVFKPGTEAAPNYTAVT